VRAVPLIALAVAGCVIASFMNPAQSNQPPATLPPLPAAPVAEDAIPYGLNQSTFKHRASTSCASASCHGGGQVGKVGSEHSTWAREAVPQLTSDPHAKAYSVLFNPVSVRMGQLLGIKEPHKDKRCLTCHAVDSASEAETRDQILSEGVGCGACHGPADKWISEHTLPSWKTTSNRDKWEKFGFVPTKNIVARTLNCVSCHVGDGERDMNHDFIAAGHPRLAFEAARYHFQPDYRKHWTEKSAPLDFEVRTWIIGQAATLRASANLLRERATRAAKNDPNTPWPELSGHSCYACHQKIADTNVLAATSETPRPAGVPGWEVWSNSASGIAADSCGMAFPSLGSVKLPEVEKLRKLMESRNAPPPAVAAAQAQKAVAELDQWLAAMQAAEDRGLPSVNGNVPLTLANKLANNALSKNGKLADHDWDAMAANYLGAAAMHHAIGGKDNAKAWHEPLLKVRDALRFPQVKDGRFDSPADRNTDKLKLLRENFELLRTKTATPGEK
jgi:hypothetical protein